LSYSPEIYFDSDEQRVLIEEAAKTWGMGAGLLPWTIRRNRHLMAAASTARHGPVRAPGDVLCSIHHLRS